MKLTVLGCWAPYPRAGGACSGYLLQSAGNNILIDCGNGVISNLQKYIDFRELDAVFISHFHPDHYMDVHCLRHAIGGARRLDKGLGPVDLYVPSEPREPFKQVSTFTEAFIVKPIESLSQAKDRSTSQGMPVYQTSVNQGGDSGKIDVFFIQTDHPKKAYAMLFAGNKKKLFYSADTKWADYLPAFARKSDLALCEASVTEEDREYTSVGHLTACQAGKLAREAAVDKLMITHFWPLYDLAAIRQEAESGFGRAVTLAGEGLVVEI